MIDPTMLAGVDIIMAGPAIPVIAAVGTFASGAASLIGAFKGGPDASTPAAATPAVVQRDPEKAKRTSEDRQRERLRSIANSGQTGTQRTGATGLQTDTADDESARRSRKTILGR